MKSGKTATGQEKEGEMNAQELAKRYQAGERNFKGVDLRGAVLKGFTLKEADFRSADLQDVDLSDANLQKTDFREALLTNANLAYADLYNANLKKSNLNSANLSRTILNRAALSGSSLCGANLAYAELSHAYLVQVDLTNADLEKADLRGAYLEKSNLTNANLSFAIVDKETTFTPTSLTGAVTQGVNLYHIHRGTLLPDGSRMTKKTDLGKYIAMSPNPEHETHPLMTKSKSNKIRFRVSFPTRDMQQALGVLLGGFHWPERCPCCGGAHDRYVSIQGGAEVVTGGYGLGKSYVGMQQRIPYCTECLQHHAFAESPKIPGLGIGWVFNVAWIIFFITIFLYFNLSLWGKIFQYLVPIFMACLFTLLTFLILHNNIKKRRQAFTIREDNIKSLLKPTCTTIKGMAAGFYADNKGAHASFSNQAYAADFAIMNGGIMEEYKIE